MSAPLLFLSSGDPSGDNATSRIVRVLKDRAPDLGVFGLGGPKLASLGQEQFAHPNDLAVLGFWEVARRYLFFRRLMLTCVREIEQRRPKAILLVDYPGFNLRLAHRVKHLGIPIIYYISPQIWAWGKKRIHEIRELVDLMLVLLPFEKEMYDRERVKSEFVGHYLLEDIPAEYIASKPPGSGQVALLPGSRRQEIERMLEPMCQAARILNRKHGTKAVVAAVKNVYDYNTVSDRYKADGVTVSYDDSRRILYESDLVLTASGTATLETGIIGRPMVIVYKTGWITYQIARRLVDLESIGLVNLVLGTPTVPELIQHEARPSTMAARLERYISDVDYCNTMTSTLRKIPSMLGGIGASERAASLIGEFL